MLAIERRVQPLSSTRPCRSGRLELGFVNCALFAVVALAPMTAVLAGPALSGRDNPRLKAIDQAARDFLTEKNIPGMAVAITKSGRLVYARGFGLADVEAGQPVQPDSLFRIASCSKSITAIAVMRLVESKKLALDDKVLPLLGIEPHVEAGKQIDPRIGEITSGLLLVIEFGHHARRCGGSERASERAGCSATFKDVRAGVREMFRVPRSHKMFRGVPPRSQGLNLPKQSQLRPACHLGVVATIERVAWVSRWRGDGLTHDRLALVFGQDSAPPG